MTRIIFFSLLLFSLLPGCGTQPPEDMETSAVRGPTPGGVYRIPLLQSPTSLDPALVHDEYGLVINQQIFEGLVRFGPHLLIEPALAATWSVEAEGTLYRFSLRDDAHFHDGSPVTAGDVIFSLERLLRTDPPSVLLPHLLMIEGAEAFRKGLADTVSGLDAPERAMVTIRLREPHIPLLVALGMYQAKIVPREAVMVLGEEFGRKPVGSGPFRFVSWEKDRQIRLERFTEYHDARAYLEEIVFRIYPGADIDAVLSDFTAQRLEEMPGYGNLRERLPQGSYSWLHRPALSLLYYGFNTEHPPLDNALFRKALSLAIDRRELVKSVYNDQFDPAGGILPPGLPGYTPNRIRLEGDLSEARRLMAQALEPNASLPPLEIVSVSKSSFATAELDYIRKRWALLGVEVSPRYIPDWTEYQRHLESDNVMIYRLVWTADMPDPDNFLAPLFHSDAASNFMRYDNPVVNTMIEDARRVSDPLERARIYGELEQSILNDSPLIPLFNLSVDLLYQPYVRDITLNALGFQDTRLHRVWLESAAD